MVHLRPKRLAPSLSTLLYVATLASYASAVKFTTFGSLSGGPCTKSGDTQCTFYTGPAWPESPGRKPEDGGTFMISPGSSYRIAWTDADKNYPVSIRWLFTGVDRGNDEVPVRWEYNVSKGSESGEYEFTPSRILTNDFPNDISNLTSVEALGQMALYQIKDQNRGLHLLTVTQDEAEDDFPDMSDTFLLATPDSMKYFETQRTEGHHAEYKKWALPVGLACGLVIPFLMALSAFAGWTMRGRRSKKTLDVKQPQ